MEIKPSEPMDQGPYQSIKIYGFDRYCGIYRWANVVNEAHIQHPEMNATDLLPYVQQMESDTNWNGVQAILRKILFKEACKMILSTLVGQVLHQHAFDLLVFLQ